MPAFWDRFTELGRTARATRPQRNWARLVEYFETHPEESAIFNAAMVSKSRAVLPAVVAAYDFTPFATIVDVGGGRGHLLARILESSPGSNGVLFELPHVIADAAPAPRTTHVAGDFLRGELPAGDVYVLMDLLHDWDDGDAARILATIRRAAPAHARVLIVETLVGEGADARFGKTLDLIMLAVTGGRERTEAQYAALLAGAGFRLARVLPTRSHYSIAEALVETR